MFSYFVYLLNVYGYEIRICHSMSHESSWLFSIDRWAKIKSRTIFTCGNYLLWKQKKKQIWRDNETTKIHKKINKNCCFHRIFLLFMSLLWRCNAWVSHCLNLFHSSLMVCSFVFVRWRININGFPFDVTCNLNISLFYSNVVFLSYTHNNATHKTDG